MNKLSSTFVGGLIAIMILFNGTLANVLGNYQSTVIVHFIGLIGIMVVLLVRKSKIKIHKSVPLYAYSAGVIGVLPILFNNISFTVLGVSITLALGLLGQSVTSIVVDHYGLFNLTVVKFNKRKLVGLTIIIIGIVIMTIY
ncbi:MAG: DMT family transporter [Clostridiales bacterium]|nr:DMT family transporter [Clostridiales bacterium]